jgi:hypothetical protein
MMLGQMMMVFGHKMLKECEKDNQYNKPYLKNGS